MKKILSFLLVLSFVFTLPGCSQPEAAYPINIEKAYEVQSEETLPASTPDTERDGICDTVTETEPSVLEPVPQDSSFQVHFLDVGQADAALVSCDGQHLLIDGGNKEDSQLIYSFLNIKNIDHLSMVVCSHAHEDHCGGLPAVFSRATADLTLCPVTSYDSNAFEDFAAYADKCGGGITIPSVGDTYSLGSATVTILGVNSTEETNDTSIVLRIDYGETSFLFTGDAEWDAEQTILSSGADLSATVLKVGHHGSDTSTGYQFLRAVAPQYAVISVGIDNDYGHPTESVLSRLRDADVTVYRTDMQGDILCVSDGKTVSFTTAKNTDIDTLSGAGAGGAFHGETNQPEEEIPATEAAAVNPATTYIVNTNTGKFHYPSCSSVDQMSEKNKLEVTETRSDLVSQGYDPCGRCNP